MSLKLIPVETLRNENGNGKERSASSHKQKSFNPGSRIKKEGNGKTGPLKNICLRLVHFINRGGKFTYQQIDDLILGMQSSILNLQKKKQEVMRNKTGKVPKKKIR